MGKYKDKLEKGFAITVEIAPPKGADATLPLEVAKKIRDRVAGVNVTDNQRAMMHMSALAFSHLLLDVGAEPILQMCCRDRNRIAMQSDMLGAWALGIENLCIMTGDYPTLGDNPQAKPVFDLDASQLIRVADQFSKGVALNGKPIKSFKEFYVGAVFNPFYDPLDLEIMKAEKKIDAGARFFQTQPFFDVASVDSFLAAVKHLNVKFLVGVTPLKSEKMIDFLNHNVLTTPIPEEAARRIITASNPEAEGLKMAAEFVNAVRDKVNGVHIMTVGQMESLPLLLDMIDEGHKA
jgi:5,10-methylenetetrahydrofolate reductase